MKINEIHSILKEHKKKQKEHNRIVALELLSDLKVPYKTKDKIHYQLNSGKGVVDFWATTYTWKPRRDGIKRSGLYEMIDWMMDFSS